MYHFEKVDITDGKCAIGYVHYLIALQNLRPICLDAPIDGADKLLINEMARVCNLIEAFLPKCEPCNLRAYATCYTLLVPFAKQGQVDATILDDVDFRILHAWMDGESCISEIEIYNIVGRHRNELPADLRSWYQRKQAEYFLAIDDAGQFSGLDLVENYRILNGLWNDEIWSRFPDCSFGKGDVAVINHISEIKELDTATLCEYYRFQTHYTSGQTPCQVKYLHDAEILDELSHRLDLDVYDRKGYALDKKAIDELIADSHCMMAHEV